MRESRWPRPRAAVTALACRHNEPLAVLETDPAVRERVRDEFEMLARRWMPQA
jgi:hypothetical protein